MAKKNNWNVVIILTILLIFAGILITYYNKSAFMENFNSNKVSIEYYSMKGCHFCEDFNPIWEEFVKKYNSQFLLKKYFIEKGGDEKAIERSKKFNINGYPTVVAVSDEKVIDTLADNNRTVDELLKFAKKNSN